MQTLEYRGSVVFLCYTHAPSEAKVSLTENINIQTCGIGWMDNTRFHAIESVLSFPVLNLAND